jgi:hypothetical protein
MEVGETCQFRRGIQAAGYRSSGIGSVRIDSQRFRVRSPRKGRVELEHFLRGALLRLLALPV